MRTPSTSDVLDVTTEVRALLANAVPLATQCDVQLEMAVQPELSVRADPRVFREFVSGLVSYTIERAVGGRVLVGGMRHGGRVQITVSDNGGGRTQSVQEGVFRDVSKALALQGGTMHIDRRSGEGTTVIVRLPEPSPDGVGSAPPRSGQPVIAARSDEPRGTWRASETMRASENVVERLTRQT